MTAKYARIPLAILAIGLASATMVEARKAPKRIDPVLTIAYELEQSTRDVHRFAARTVGYPTLRERRALVRLAELQQQTRRFRLDLERFGPYHPRVRRELGELRWTFGQARNSVGALFAHVQWKQSFRDVGALMRELDFRYERRLAATGRRLGPHGHGVGKGYAKVHAKGKAGRVDVVYDWDDDEYRDHAYRRDDQHRNR